MAPTKAPSAAHAHMVFAAAAAAHLTCIQAKSQQKPLCSSNRSFRGSAEGVGSDGEGAAGAPWRGSLLIAAAGFAKTGAHHGGDERAEADEEAAADQAHGGVAEGPHRAEYVAQLLVADLVDGLAVRLRAAQGSVLLACM